MAVVALAPVLIFGPRGTLDWSAPTGVWGIVLAMGLLGTVGHLLMTWSLRFAPGATLAPMQYLEIPFATFYGWALFGDLPDGMAAAGIAVTMAAGLYVILRERATSRAARQVRAATLPPPPPAE
jgi:drug/metabolite transporter (DMT)-like permease